MSNKLFTTVPVPKFPRSTFNLSRPVLFTPRLHRNYPTEIIEILPGDGMKISSEVYAKSQPMVAPSFAKMDVAQEAFFVPAWQLSEHFDDFITGGERGTFNEKMPYVTVANIYEILLAWVDNMFYVSAQAIGASALYNKRLDMFVDIIDGLDVSRAVPIVMPDFVQMPATFSSVIAQDNYEAFRDANEHLSDANLRVNLLPFAAQLKIWCEFYRDENLCEDLYEIFWIRSFGYDNEYYRLTGNVNAQFSQDASYSGSHIGLEFLHAIFGVKRRAWKKDYFTSALPFVQKGPDVVLPIAAGVTINGPSGMTGVEVEVTTNSSGKGQFYAGAGRLDLSVDSAAIGTSIQDVRTAFKLEEMYEADGRFGNRYPENTLGQWGVHTPDSRLPRCQFLGSSRQPVQIQQVVQNSQTASTPQGNLAGLSSSYGSNRLCKTYQSQHGFLICFTAVRVHSLYEQGVHPMFSRFDRTEYAWPRFAHLGEQPIYVKQLFVDDSVQEDEVFGYTPRYADYKSDNGSIHGLLKGSLNVWSMARRFANKPQLNEEFIYGQPRQDAFVVSNPEQSPFVMEIDYHVRANRILPFYGQPHM